MNFIRYNPLTGELTSAGYMEPKFVQEEIDQDLPTLFASDIYDPTEWQVNLQTKQIEKVGAKSL